MLRERRSERTTGERKRKGTQKVAASVNGGRRVKRKYRKGSREIGGERRQAGKGKKKRGRFTPVWHLPWQMIGLLKYRRQ